MLPMANKWTLCLLLFLGVKGSAGEIQHAHAPNRNETTIIDPVCTGNVTVFDTTTLLESTVLSKTNYVYVNVTSTSVVEVCITVPTTTTLHYTISTTEVDSYTVSTTEVDSYTVSTTETDSTTITNSATVTNTETTTQTVPATITTYTTTTVLSTKVDPCPTECSISVETVNLYFWPTNRPYTYPSTWFDESLGYTFTSPSVYMLIPTAQGTNSLGPTGPATSKWILPLELDEVSTIADGSVTRQLTLSDLGTDCPQTAEPSAIATMVDPRCDPILAAPKQVSSWAYPCNACGRFGLFDPPYAVPTVTGLFPTTTATPPPQETTAPPTPTATTPPTSSPPAPPSSAPETSSSALPTPSVIPSVSSVPSVVPTAAASRVTGDFAWLIVGVSLVMVFM
ncbi:uncharacterized protein E0L32_002608 [Thyridium curvatum]|uniref:Uncharacterized protein n=1 Tax=Thyridium curvatum TaxID=1093900 RepID=A0A507BNC9_9PEZI|nr:uncharacterized protein E0L32_002608 [Thyridium curvatum]TPX18751.1 hypothetical protein E0L32_002608 [Thyridium curvatum]